MSERTPNELRFDSQGNPMTEVGCPNCGKDKRWVSQLEYFGARNAGRDLAGPCSTPCRLQLEYADELAARRAEPRGDE